MARRPYRKKVTKRFRKKRYTRRMKVGNPKQKVFYYKRHVDLGTINAVADSTDVLAVIDFALVDVPSYAEFTALYDSYKINAVKVKLLPTYSQVSSVNVANHTSAQASSALYSSWNNLRIFSALDYNSGTAAASINAMREYQNCKMTQYTKGHSRYFKPKFNLIQSANEYVQIFTKTNPWLSTSYAGAPHYSLLLGIDTSLLDPASIAPDDKLLRVEATYYLSFKAPR